MFLLFSEVRPLQLCHWVNGTQHTCKAAATCCQVKLICAGSRVCACAYLPVRVNANVCAYGSLRGWRLLHLKELIGRVANEDIENNLHNKLDLREHKRKERST